IDELRFHLYLNAFSHSETTFLRGDGGPRDLGPEGWGWINVTSISVVNGEDLTARMEFIQPDDGNPADRTVMRVSLPAPVGPLRSIRLAIRFSARLPEVVARTGYSGDFFFVGQWFPKIGVYEPKGTRGATGGRWNCHQFHAETEFYADFGVYDVSITLPTRFVVGATGAAVSDRWHPDSTRTITYHAEDVHDFAWTAWPGFRELSRRWGNVEIRMLLPEARLGKAERHFNALAAAMAYMDSCVGPYPYPTFTLVDPPPGAGPAGGMEYPTLVTVGGFSLPGIPVRGAEIVTVHEFVHNYFQGMVASNEFEEAWLDEGFTQYYEERIMEATYGARSSLLDWLGIRIGNREFSRGLYTGSRNPSVAPIATPAWKFEFGGYGMLTYFKSMVMLQTLDGLIGRAVMDSVMKTYFRRWRFRHPSGEDFIAVVNEIVPGYHRARLGPDMNWFFDQFLRGTGVCDYALTALSNVRTGRPEGRVPDGPVPADSAKTLVATVTVSRLGDITVPVEVRVFFEDGTEITEWWDGRERNASFSYRRGSRAVKAIVDPGGKILADVNVINNSRAAAPDSSPARPLAARLVFWLQTLLQSVGVLG
ncbi:MAG: peptidase, partial [Bacteroidetes bacterium]|nr:peptidase [Bacteroidota bacterium]